MATIQDVAKHAHVGAATVSRVLSGNGYVKDATRQKVLEAIEALDYTPNEMARNLFYRKTGIIAVIVPEISHPFFAEFINAVEVALCDLGYQTMICNTYYVKNYEQRYLDMLKRRMVDGVIFGSHTVDVSRYQNLDRPFVALDRDLGPTIPCVSSNHAQGGLLAAQELLRCGCRNVLQFGGHQDETGRFTVSTPSNMRHTVFAEVLRGHGVTCHAEIMKWNSFDYGYYQEITNAIFDRYPDLDGIFTTDVPILATLKAAKAHGRRVPEDVKLVGYDGVSLMDLITPSITTVVQPITELARECVRLVIDQIQGKQPDQYRIELPVTLRRGDSTRLS